MHTAVYDRHAGSLIVYVQEDQSDVLRLLDGGLAYS